MAVQRVWPFVGRESLLRDVIERLEGHNNVVLCGAAGLGKTRLASEVATRLSATRVLVHRVAASPPSAHLPLAPFAGLIAHESTNDIVGVVLRALGADGKSGAGDPVLIVDDMHLLDDSSAAVLQQVLLSGHVRLLGTMRTVETQPAAVSRLRQETSVTNVEVPRLRDEEIIEIVEHALGGALDGRSRQLFSGACAGNPLYARELVDGSIAAGTLRAHNGLWTLEGEMAATPLLEEVVLARLTPLSTEEWAALELFAVGGQLPYRLLQQMVDVEILERLERQQVVHSVPVTASQQIQLDVVHPLYRELIRARLGVLARRGIYRKLAMAEDELAASDYSSLRAETIRSAMWHLRGEVDIGADALLTAARDAAAIGESPLAAELAEVAYRRGGGIRAALLASWSLGQCGRNDESIAILKEAADHSTDPWEQAATRLRVSEELWWTSRQREARQYLDEMALPAGPWLDLLEAQRGVFAVLEGNLPEAWRRCRPLVDHPHLWVRLVAAIAVGIAGVFGDRIDETMQVSGSAATDAAASSPGSPGEVGLLGDPQLHLTIQLVAMVHNGDLRAAVEFAEFGYASTIRQSSVQVRAWAAMILGQALAVSGDLAKSCRYLNEAELGWASVGFQGFAKWCASGLAQSQAELGEVELAQETLRRADAYDLEGFRMQEALVEIARAWVAAAGGDRATAAATLASALQNARESHQWTHVAELWHESARLNLLDVVGGVELWQRPSARLGAARFDFVHARLSGSPADLEAASTTFETLGAILYAAEAAATAAACARGQATAKECSRLGAVAGQLASHCGEARTPLLNRVTRGPLSARELEIAQLAKRGLTNQQIAEHLIISRRTVENHIYRIYTKLGIDSRSGLAEALPRS